MFEVQFMKKLSNTKTESKSCCLEKKCAASHLEQLKYFLSVFLILSTILLF